MTGDSQGKTEPPQLRREKQANRRAGEEERAGVVDAMGHRFSVVSQRYGDQRQCGGSHRQVDVKNPAPGKRVSDQAAEERTRHAAGGENASEQSLIPAPLAWDDQVADGGFAQGLRGRPRPDPAGRGTQ